jgi:hypothetical protein
MIDERRSFSLKKIPVTLLAQPARCLRKAYILLFHLAIGVCLAAGLSQTFLTIPWNPSLCNQPSSNLNVHLLGGLGVPVVKSVGAWPDNP